MQKSAQEAVLADTQAKDCSCYFSHLPLAHISMMSFYITFGNILFSST